MSMFATAFAAAWVSLAMGWPTVAVAADAAEDDLIRRGVEARRRSDDQVALDLFRKAYEMHHGARAEAQMGLAEIALGLWDEATRHLEHAMSARGDAWIQKNDKVLRTSLAQAQSQFGALQVLGGPEGAEIVIEGRVMGTLPVKQAIRVRIGECRFYVRAPGYADVVRTVAMESQTLRRETVELSPLPKSPSDGVGARAYPSAADPTAAGDMAGPAPNRTGSGQRRAARLDEAGAGSPSSSSASSAAVTASASADPRAGGRRQHSGQRVAGVVLGVVGVAAIGAGLVAGLEARAKGQQNSQAGNTFNPGVETNGKRLQTWQYVGYAAGGALLLTGVLTYVLGLDDEARAGVAWSRGLRVQLGSDATTLSWSDRF